MSCAAFEFTRATTLRKIAFRQKGFIGEIHCSRPKVVNGVRIGAASSLMKKYDELRWFCLTCVTAYERLQVLRAGLTAHRAGGQLSGGVSLRLGDYALVRILYGSMRPSGNRDFDQS